MKTPKITEIEIETNARAKAFSSEGVRENKFLVRGKTVKVWDSIAGYYTNCNAMSATAKARIAKIAANA